MRVAARLTFVSLIHAMLGLFVASAARSQGAVVPHEMHPSTSPGQCEPSSFKVAIDVGHTLTAPGAISARGVPEFSFNQALAKNIFTELVQRGFSKSFMVGESGLPLALEDRTRIATQRGARLFLSIHHDSVQSRYLTTWQFKGKQERYSDRFHGFSVFYSEENAQASESKVLAKMIGEALVDVGFTPSLHHAEQVPGEGRPLLDPRIGLYRFDRLVVLRTAPMPAALLEAGLIVNRDEEAQMQDAETMHRQARGVAQAVAHFCSVVGLRTTS